MPSNNKTHEIKGVEIFASGTWNGDKYTEKDLELMVEAYNQTKDKVKPFAKLGHDDAQFLAQQDGYPAVGWITNIYKKGKKILADFAEVPDKVYQLIKHGAYRRVSSEIFWNMKLGDKVYKRVIAAVAFLGGDTPAVTTLDDILNLYGLTQSDIIKYEGENDVHVYSLNYDEINLEEKMEKELKQKIEELEQENVTLKEYKEGKEKEVEEALKELKELKEYKQEAELEKKRLTEEKEKVEVEKYLDELQNDKLITKASRNYVQELLSDKKEYSLNEKKFDKKGLIKEIFSLHKESFSSVNFEENSQNTDDKNKDEDFKINEYMKEHDCDYRAAYKAVVK